MPYSFAVRHDLRLIIRTVSGIYDDAQAIASAREFSLIDESDVYSEIHDLSGVTSYDVTAGTLQSMALDSVAREGDDFQPKRVAIVTSDAVAFGMARLYTGYHADSKETMRYFDRLDDAFAWMAE